MFLDRIIGFFTGYPKARPPRSFIPVGRGPRVYVDASGDLIYATCVNILAQAMAQCHWTVYDPQNNPQPDAAPGLRRALNIEPYPGLNAFDFWEYMERQRLGNGNAFALINNQRTTAIQYLVPLDAAAMTVMWDDANILDGARKIVYQYRDPRSGQTFTILPEEILHLKAFSSNGVVGRSAISVLSEALAANAEVESAMRSTVTNGFAGTIVLSYTSDLSRAKQKQLQADVVDLLQDSDHTILPLPVGMTATNIANDIRSYYETIKNTKTEDISALFGIPLAMLNKMGGTGAATFSATQMMSFYCTTVLPIISRYAAELTNKLLTREQQNGGYQIATENDVFDSLDAQSKASVLCSYAGAGILTANEARASLKYPRSMDPAADVLTQRGGTGSLGDSPGSEQGNDGENKEGIQE